MMSNVKKIFSCNNCGAKYPKWMGMCSQCGEWNTVEEEIIQSKNKNEPKIILNTSKIKEIKEINYETKERIETNDSELNRVLGGGIVQGSLILISGEPGIGKSTLLLTVAHRLAQKGLPVLYVSAEESLSQTRLRADRLDALHDDLYLLSETNMDVVEKEIQKRNMKPTYLLPLWDLMGISLGFGNILRFASLD